MTTFVQWLNDQRKRQDLVGEFATFWHNLKQRPRLSSPVSILKHLDERQLLPQPLRASSPDGAPVPTVQDAYDATLHEYRANRGELVRAVVDEAQDPLPGMPEQPVTAAGEALARSRAIHPSTGIYSPAEDEPEPHPGAPATPGVFHARLKRIEHKIDLIMMSLGVQDGYGPPQPDGIDWQQLWDMADHEAQA